MYWQLKYVQHFYWNNRCIIYYNMITVIVVRQLYKCWCLSWSVDVRLLLCHQLLWNSSNIFCKYIHLCSIAAKWNYLMTNQRTLKTLLNSVKDKVQKMNNHCGFPHELSCLNTALQVTSGGRKMGSSALSYIGSELDSKNCQCVI